jgi:hypothetical protein
MDQLTHIIITRFSYRGREAFTSIGGPTFLRNEDPLDPARLELRFKMFEIACLPSVLGQTDQRFAWIILVDRDLPEHFYRRLVSLVQARQRTFIHVFDPLSSLAELKWLSGHARSNGYLITTNLDDDDCIPTCFVAQLQHHMTELDRHSALPPIGIIGAKSALEWDLIPSAAAPLGWKAPWHRSRWVMSVGLSLYCRVPQFDLCVLGLRHTMADSYLDFSKPPVNLNARWFQRTVASAAKANNFDLRNWQPAALFHDISPEAGAVLLVNHGGNDQATRLTEKKAGRVPVAGAGDFPGLAIDWQKARIFAEALSRESWIPAW